MILDDAAQLEVLAADLAVLRRSQQHSQSLGHRRQIVDAFVARAVSALSSSASIAQRLGDIPSSSPLFEVALAKINEWRLALETDLGLALSGDLFKNFQESVDKAVRELERQAAASWQRYVAQKTPDTSEEVLTALAADSGARSTIIQIRRLSETLRRLRALSFPSPEELDDFDGAAAELRRVWSTLNVASVSDEVVAFLRAASSEQGASLVFLTDSVREWLAQRGAVDHYVIRPADT